MKNLVFILLLLICSQLGFGQITKIKLEVVETYPRDVPPPMPGDSTDKIFTTIDTSPVPRYGLSGLYADILNAVKWERELLREKTIGDIELTFLVDMLLLKEFEIDKDEVGHGVADAIIAALEAKHWSMGIHSGRPLKTRFKLSIGVDCSGFEGEKRM